MIKNLNKLTFVISIAGILLLLMISALQKPLTINISEITKKQLTKEVNINSKITSVKNIKKYNLLILNLKDPTGEINATLNYKTAPPNLKYSSYALIKGRVNQYNQELQIEINKIKI